MDSHIRPRKPGVKDKGVEPVILSVDSDAVPVYQSLRGAVTAIGDKRLMADGGVSSLSVSFFFTAIFSEKE